MMPKYLEDFEVGQIMRFGSCAVTRDEVIEFARKFDPQPFHLDDAAAAATFFGRLAASGWHTAAMVMRMIVDNWQSIGGQSLGSPGIDQLRWLKPVYPGDTLRVESEILSIEPSRSRADRGSAMTRITTFNQFDEPVMQFQGVQFLARRPAADQASGKSNAP